MDRKELRKCHRLTDFLAAATAVVTAECTISPSEELEWGSDDDSRDQIGGKCSLSLLWPLMMMITVWETKSRAAGRVFEHVKVKVVSVHDTDVLRVNPVWFHYNICWENLKLKQPHAWGNRLLLNSCISRYTISNKNDINNHVVL